MTCIVWYSNEEKEILFGKMGRALPALFGSFFIGIFCAVQLSSVMQCQVLEKFVGAARRRRAVQSKKRRLLMPLPLQRGLTLLCHLPKENVKDKVGGKCSF